VNPGGNAGGNARGNARGFALMLVFAVAVSIVLGLLVERFTAPGWERTFWFGVGLTAILFPAGRYAERRGWIQGFWYAGPAARPRTDEPVAVADPAPSPRATRPDAEAAPAPSAAPLQSRDDAATPSITRASSGETR